MNIGPIGLALIKEFETLRLAAYNDGGGVWTIGWGHTKGVKPGDVCTRAQADAWLVDDAQGAVAEVNLCLGGLTVNQQQFDALVSFEFNTGGLAGSTLLKKLRVGDVLGAAREFPRWDKDNGKELKGLTRRRLREQALFTSV